MDAANGVATASTIDDDSTFEETFGRLHEMIARLEQGGLPLAEAIDAFERGIWLANRCTEILDAAELRITRVLEAEQVDLEEPAF